MEFNNSKSKFSKGLEDSNRANVDEGVLVRIEDYDPESHSLKVNRLEDNSPLGNEQTVNTAIEQKKVYELNDKKVLKVDDDPKGPVVEVTRAYARLSGNNDYGFFSYKEGGNFIKGPLSLISMPNQIRLSALTTLNPLLISCFPSTIVTPIPTCIWSIPNTASIKSLMKDVLLASTLLAATGG